MSQQEIVILIVVGGVIILVGLFHERRAMKREDRAVDRHNDEVALIVKNNYSTLAAINQRNRLVERTLTLEEAINEHAAHLEKLGVEAPARVQVGERLGGG